MQPCSSCKKIFAAKLNKKTNQKYKCCDNCLNKYQISKYKVDCCYPCGYTGTSQALARHGRTLKHRKNVKLLIETALDSRNRDIPEFGPYRKQVRALRDALDDYILPELVSLISSFLPVYNCEALNIILFK